MEPILIEAFFVESGSTVMRAAVNAGPGLAADIAEVVSTFAAVWSAPLPTYVANV